MHDEPIADANENPLAHQWLQARDPAADRTKHLLLASIDGRRNVVELESLARELGLAPDVLEQLRDDGMIDLSS